MTEVVGEAVISNCSALCYCMLAESVGRKLPDAHACHGDSNLRYEVWMDQYRSICTTKQDKNRGCRRGRMQTSRHPRRARKPASNMKDEARKGGKRVVSTEFSWCLIPEVGRRGFALVQSVREEQPRLARVVPAPPPIRSVESRRRRSRQALGPRGGRSGQTCLPFASIAFPFLLLLVTTALHQDKENSHSLVSCRNTQTYKQTSYNQTDANPINQIRGRDIRRDTRRDMRRDTKRSRHETSQTANEPPPPHPRSTTLAVHTHTVTLYSVWRLNCPPCRPPYMRIPHLAHPQGTYDPTK